jgi:hypothetical protein
MAKCPHCGKELEFTVIPRKPKAVSSVAKAKIAKAAGKKVAAKPAVKPAAKKAAVKQAAKPAVKTATEPQKPPKRPLLKNPDFLSPGGGL